MNAKDRSKNAFALLVDSTNQGVLAGLKIVQVDPYDARGLAWGAIETNIGRDKVHVNIAYSNHNDQITLALQQAAQAGAAATREKLEALRRVGPNERVIVNYELDCPPPVDGESLGLACGLVLAEYVVRHGGLVTSEELAKREPPVANPAPQLPETYAATGCIPRRGGDITRRTSLPRRTLLLLP